MNKDVCKRFKNVREWLPDQLDSKREHQIDDKHFNEYCTNKCKDPLDKINAGCLYLLNEFFRDSSAFDEVAKKNIYIVQYILIWLSYMLNLDKSGDENFIENFYNTYIRNGSNYTTSIKYTDDYTDYKDLIDTNKYFLSMDMSIISKLYDAFNILCDIYNELDTNDSNCEKCSQKANQFVETYKKIIIYHNTTDEKSHLHVVFTLLIYYENLKNRCNIFPSAPDITQIISEVTSSSSIASKLIPILSILVAIAIFFGISYKVNNKEFKKIIIYMKTLTNNRTLKILY
ncbi:putative yir3 protein [Plasmodium yoelii yoelii]|uniref:Yir3 protein n=1 Tax=Plasmodium yoelii yoelii TaxID=73239 RepID=Q7RI80_PLAYO|nr:putative yir3 protein [Plasmodium yoelii yoelii]